MPQALALPCRAHRGTRAPPDKPAAASSSRHGLAFAKPVANGLLSQPVDFQDRFTPSPATGSAIRRVQGVFHPEEHLRPGRLSPETRAKTVADRRVDLYPQVVPILWIRGPRLSFIPRNTVL